MNNIIVLIFSVAADLVNEVNAGPVLSYEERFKEINLVSHQYDIFKMFQGFSDINAENRTKNNNFKISGKRLWSC